MSSIFIGDLMPSVPPRFREGEMVQASSKAWHLTGEREFIVTIQQPPVAPDRLYSTKDANGKLLYFYESEMAPLNPGGIGRELAR